MSCGHGLARVKPNNSNPGSYLVNRKHILMVIVRKLNWGRGQGEIVSQQNSLLPLNLHYCVLWSSH